MPHPPSLLTTVEILPTLGKIALHVHSSSSSSPISDLNLQLSPDSQQAPAQALHLSSPTLPDNTSISLTTPIAYAPESVDFNVTATENDPTTLSLSGTLSGALLGTASMATVRSALFAGVATAAPQGHVDCPERRLADTIIPQLEKLLVSCSRCNHQLIAPGAFTRVGLAPSASWSDWADLWTCDVDVPEVLKRLPKVKPGSMFVGPTSISCSVTALASSALTWTDGAPPVLDPSSNTISVSGPEAAVVCARCLAPVGFATLAQRAPPPPKPIEDSMDGGVDPSTTLNTTIPSSDEAFDDMWVTPEGRSMLLTNVDDVRLSLGQVTLSTNKVPNLVPGATPLSLLAESACIAAAAEAIARFVLQAPESITSPALALRVLSPNSLIGSATVVPGTNTALTVAPVVKVLYQLVQGPDAGRKAGRVAVGHCPDPSQTPLVADLRAPSPDTLDVVIRVLQASTATLPPSARMLDGFHVGFLPRMQVFVPHSSTS